MVHKTCKTQDQKIPMKQKRKKPRKKRKETELKKLLDTKCPHCKNKILLHNGENIIFCFNRFKKARPRIIYVNKMKLTITEIKKIKQMIRFWDVYHK